MQQKLKFKKIDEEAYKFKITNVAPPITEINDDVEYNTPNVSDDGLSDEENDNNNVQTVSDWQTIVSRWINMLEDDSELENTNIDYDENYNKDDDENDDEDDISVINISNLSHPAINKNAKWKLQDIFIENLEISNYLANFINNNN